MSKELDYLDKILTYQPLTLVERTIIECIKEKIQRLEAIDNANPSEVLECLNCLERLHDCGVFNYEEMEDYNTIKQALLKAEKEHNSVNLLMQELDCKDFADLRKYARCGYEKLNKKYLKWEDLEFTRDEKVMLVKMGNTVYKVLYRRCDSIEEVQLLSEDEKLFYISFVGKYKDNVQLFNDLHLERVEE